MINSINSRIFDLIEIFKNQHYVSPGFKGSYSIKNIQPILAPNLSYTNLEDILEYCKLDTLAMVEIWKKLG